MHLTEWFSSVFLTDNLNLNCREDKRLKNTLNFVYSSVLKKKKDKMFSFLINQLSNGLVLPTGHIN